MCGGDFFCCLFICFVLFVCCKVQSPQPKRKKNSETKIKKKLSLFTFRTKVVYYRTLHGNTKLAFVIKISNKGKKMRVYCYCAHFEICILLYFELPF